MMMRKMVRTTTPPIQNGIPGSSFFAKSTGTFASVLIAHSRISVLKNVSPLAMQPQGVILFVWDHHPLFTLIKRQQGLPFVLAGACRDSRRRRGPLALTRTVDPGTRRRLIIARSEVPVSPDA